MPRAPLSSSPSADSLVGQRRQAAFEHLDEIGGVQFDLEAAQAGGDVHRLETNAESVEKGWHVPLLGKWTDATDDVAGPLLGISWLGQVGLLAGAALARALSDNCDRTGTMATTGLVSQTARFEGLEQSSGIDSQRLGHGFAVGQVAVSEFVGVGLEPDARTLRSEQGGSGGGHQRRTARSNFVAPLLDNGSLRFPHFGD